MGISEMRLQAVPVDARVDVRPGEPRGTMVTFGRAAK